MDGTLLQGRTIFHLAEKKGFKKELKGFINSSLQPYEKTIEIAKLLKGISKDELLSLFHEIPFRPHVNELISTLKKHGFIIALATDSYDIVANAVKGRLSLDYSFANNLIFNDTICTGEVKIHNTEYVADEITSEFYSISKSCVLEQLCISHKISLQESIAVGDGMVDCGMLKKAGLGIAVYASKEVNRCANISTNNLMDILSYVNGR